MIITITGDLESGKSSIAKLLADKLNHDFLSTGALFREIAQSKGMDVNELTEAAKNDSSIDMHIDDLLIKFNKDNYVIDSRMAWKFIDKSFKIFFTVNEIVAAKIIYTANRENEHYASLDETVKYISRRKCEEDRRYQNLYGVDVNDYLNYDLVIDTSSISVKETMDIILSKLNTDCNK